MLIAHTVFSDQENQGQKGATWTHVNEEAMNTQSIKLALILNNLKIKAKQRTTGHETVHPKHKGVFSRLLAQTLKPGRMPHLQGGKRGTKTEGTGQGWLEHFRDELISSGIPVEEMSLSREALPDLKKILIGQGYPESAVMSFLNGLFHGKTEHEIKLVKLFERLSELKALFDKKSADPALEVSAVPCLEAALSRLGLDLQGIKSAIEPARAQGGGLNLKSLVRNLKDIIRGLPEGNRLGADGKAAEDIKGMLARVGIVDKASNIDGPISLERFVRILEQRVASLMPRSLSESQIENHVNDLLGNVLVARKQQGGKSSIESLYAHKLNGLPPDDSKANTGVKQVAEGLKDQASQAKTAGAGMEKLIEPIHERRGKKTIDQEKLTSPHSVRESMMDRGPAPGAVTKQGARPVPFYVVNQVARQISLSLQRGKNHLMLQLKPPELGAIQINMDMKDSVLKIGMVTEDNGVKEFLVSSIQELRDSLVQNGVKVERIDVQVNHNLGGSMYQARRGQNGFQQQREGQRGEPGALTHNQDVSQEITPAMLRADALVDLVA